MNFSQTGKTCEISTPGHAVDKDPPANVIDMGFMPGPGRSHTLWINEVCAPHLLSLSAATAEAHTPGACALQQVIAMRSLRTHKEQPLLTAAGESPCAATKIQHRQKLVQKMHRIPPPDSEAPCAWWRQMHRWRFPPFTL